MKPAALIAFVLASVVSWSCGIEKPEACDDGNRLASTYITRCGADPTMGVCLHGNGQTRYAGCMLHAGTEANPDDVECVTSCP